MYARGLKPYQYQMCMMLMDTNQERNINLGDRYKFRPLQQGECWVNYQMSSSLDVEEDHAVKMYINMF